MNCPTCFCPSHVEVNLNADGYARNLLECGQCGAVWSLGVGRGIVVYEEGHPACGKSGPVSLPAEGRCS